MKRPSVLSFVVFFMTVQSPFGQAQPHPTIVERLSQLHQLELQEMNQLFVWLKGEKAKAGPLKTQFYKFLLADAHLADGRPAEAVKLLEQIMGSPRFKKLDQLAPTLRHEIMIKSAVAYLRLGEVDNCILKHNPESCIFPIQTKGVHAKKNGVRLAVKQLKKTLSHFPDDTAALWLLNISYMLLGQYPERVPKRWLLPLDSMKSEVDLGRFRDISAEVGINFDAHAGGAIFEDFDGDGLLDIVVSGCKLDEEIKYFHNDGNGKFSDRSHEAHLDGITGALNIVQTDYNNDGHPDLLMARGGWNPLPSGEQPMSLLKNKGDGTFEDVTEAAGLMGLYPTQAVAWADYDNDGYLDLFVGPESYGGKSFPAKLFHNNGDGTFTDMASDAGLAITGVIKGATWGDYDNDGLIDLYVSRFRENNVLFKNMGKDSHGRWHFKDVTHEAGVPGGTQNFATWFFDYDNDGFLDLFSGTNVNYFAGMAPETQFSAPLALFASFFRGKPVPEETWPHLYHNEGNGTFKDVTTSSKLNRAVLSMGGNFGDLDNDGFLDIYLGTGNPDFSSLVPNLAFKNVEGKVFQDITMSSGLGHLQKGHAVAFGDWTNTGRLDVLEEIGGAFPGDHFRSALFQNPGNANNWIKIELEGTTSNRPAIGARIHLTVKTESGLREIYRSVSTGGSFGASPFRQEIGLGKAIAIEKFEIKWPATGKTQKYDGPPLNQMIHVKEGKGTWKVIPLKGIQSASSASPEGPVEKMILKSPK